MTLPSIIGDGSPNGWATFVVYLGAAWLCFRNARHSIKLSETGKRRVSLAQSRRRFWIVLAALLLLLGLTRQFDIQALVAAVARGEAQGSDVYEARRGLQLALVLTIGIFGTIGLLIALVTFRRAEGSSLVALAGTALLILFTVIRMVSLHAIDRFLQRGLPHAQINNLIEIGALALIAAASFAFSRTLHAEGRDAHLRAVSIEMRRRRLGEKRRVGRS